MTKVTAADGHEYHKSATANAPVAPTNEATIENAGKTKGLTPAQSEFITVVDYEYNLSGKVDAEYIQKEYGYSPDEWKTFTSDSVMIEALVQRGISAKWFSNTSVEVAKRTKLTPVQLIVANSMMDLTDTRSVRKKLQDCGVSSYQYQAWLRDPDFSHYLRERAENLLGDVSHEAALALVDKVLAGDLNAIKYYNEMTGRYIEQRTSNTGSTGSHDLQQMIVRIIEIVLDEVEDPAIASKIADKLKALVTGQQVAGILPVGVELEQPEVAAPREITPEVQQLMNRGVGYNG